MVDVVDLLSDRAQRQGVEAAAGASLGAVAGYLSEKSDYDMNIGEDTGLGAVTTAISDGADEAYEAVVGQENDILESEGDLYAFGAAFVAGSQYGERKARQRELLSQLKDEDEDMDVDLGYDDDDELRA